MLKGVCDITPFSMQDFPDTLSAIIWFCGCNLRCFYCHNLDIVDGEASLSEEQVLEFLTSRKGLLEGVVLSGGEATLYPNLKEFTKEIKKLGFKIKLDTNGTKPNLIKEMIEESLLDYVAVDFKASKELYQEVTKSKNLYEENLNSIKTVAKGNIDYEVRITYHSDFFSEDVLSKMYHLALEVGVDSRKIRLQNYVVPSKYELGLAPSKEVRTTQNIRT